MVERKTLVSVLLIIVLVSIAGYGVGRFSTLEERVTTSTSIVTTTQTTTSSTTLTEIETKTTTFTTAIVRETPHIIPPPANSTAIIRGYLLFNGSIFVTFSIDKPVYSLGEVVHIKGTVTNLTPRNISLEIEVSMTWIVNSTGKRVWAYPESNFGASFGPAPVSWIELGPGETGHFLPHATMTNAVQ